ncbi:ABC transporter substrate-binding protein [Paenibacillus abyssi]|uniref:ABC transporter substrate-binding protein n=1 Tax=Paenibacillus abyssi TaxID=1340531 RepID=A0A917G4E6_9BACL|nr:ABC transporter substrate-binding protein [Paenibacillus abyssi]GGG22418.1 ABC transporter substrate-binding protein [Paenibacillus abyssi]
MRKTFVSVLVLLLAAVLVLTACGGTGNTTAESNTNNSTATNNNPSAVAEDEPVTIIIANGKGELTALYEQAAKDFMTENPNITVEVHTGAVGDSLSVLDRLTSSGVVVTLAMVEPNGVLEKYKDFGIDLSGERWVEETNDAIKNAEGTIVGFPFSIEGFGLVYNKQVVENAVGGSFDPFSINTRDKLIALFDQLQASGVQYPVAYQTEGWSVSNHYSSQFLNQAEDPNSIVNQLKAGTFDLASNEVWNGYYDTMDLLASEQYNKYGERPIGQYYDDAHVSVGKGESAILFNGNWAFDSLQAVAGDSFGFIPVPVDNNPDNPLNNKIVAGPTNIYIINKDATPAQQEAAKKYLNWLVYDEVGQDWLVNKAQVISAFKNNPHKVTNPLGAAIAVAIAQGKTMPFSTNYIVPGDWFSILGPEVQQYIDKRKSREDLAQAIQSYYTSN